VNDHIKYKSIGNGTSGGSKENSNTNRKQNKMIRDQDLQTLYNEYMEFTGKKITEGNAMAVAGIMLAQALSIYKTALSSDEFDQIIQTISDTKNQVKTFQPSHLH
jgi:hypothetical protein